MLEFFVLRRERRAGVGSRAANAVFDLHPGHWEVSKLLRNERAIRFWRRVIGKHTSGRFVESSTTQELRRTFRSRGAATTGGQKSDPRRLPRGSCKARCPAPARRPSRYGE